MATQSDNDGWIEWAGGECPVAGHVLVDIKHADGTCSPQMRADDLIVAEPHGFDWWRHLDPIHTARGGFVKAYRMVPA